MVAESPIAVGSLPMCETRLFINNEFVEATSNSKWENLNPANEEVLSVNQEASNADVDKAVAAAREAFKKLKDVSGKTRRDWLHNLANLVLKHADQLALLESLDNGKPVTIAKVADLKLVSEVLKYYGGWADKIQGKLIPIESLGQGDQNYLCFTKHEPVGVAGQIIPWNFPLLMLTWKIAPAVAMGCTVVLKTSEKTPLSAMTFAYLIREAGFPPGVINIISGFGPTVGNYLVRHPGIDKVAFTGSTISGKKVIHACNECDMLKRVSVELGGKSPLIVLDDANLDVAVETANLGLFFNQGQCCIASSRIFVEETIYDKFVEKVVAKARQAVVASPQSPECTQGPQVDKLQYDKILGYIESGKKEGAKMYTTEKSNFKKGYYIDPVVFTDVTDDMKIAKEEIFGPVMSIFKFKTVEEVIERANATQYGLGAGICSTSLGRSMKIMHQLRAGTIYINCYDVFDAAAPFGGFKNSGIGRELGEYGLEEYTEVKTVVANLTV